MKQISEIIIKNNFLNKIYNAKGNIIKNRINANNKNNNIHNNKNNINNNIS